MLTSLTTFVNPIIPQNIEYSEGFEKIDVSKYPKVLIDAEWYKETFLTKQFTFTDNSLKPFLTAYLCNSDYPLPVKYPTLDHQLIIIKGSESTTISDIFKLGSKLKVYMFYSPKDLTATFGAARIREAYKNKDINKKRNVNGKFTIDDTEVSIQDTLGLFNDSLEKAFESVGIDTSDSKALAKDRDKGRMDLWIKDDPDSFLAYAVGDTVLLAEAIKKRVDQLNLIINNTFPDYHLGTYSIDTIKYSSGSLVNDVFVRWFAHKYPDMFRVLLKQSASNDCKAWGDIKRMTVKIEGENDPLKLLKVSNGLRYSNIVHGMSAGGIKGIGVTAQNTTGIYGTVVQGGRCLNEEPKLNPYEGVINNVIDVDLSSCYGTALREFDFPVGLPTIYGKKKDDDIVSLGAFLKQNETDMVDGLYCIYVKGLLNESPNGFSQDLVHSKYELTTSKLLSKLFNIIDGKNVDSNTFDGWEREVETAHMGGNFLLTKKQIELGIITADVLKVLRKVATVAELKEWMSLTVESAVWYPNSLELSNEGWVKAVENNLGKDTAKADYRNRSWTRIPLEGFIGGFIDYRRSVKKRVENKGDLNDLLQTSVKLFINTMYGCLAAPYFETGNTVLANNITAKARTGSWMLSKALLTVQIITDGGMFCGDRVAVLKNKTPSLTTLANRERFLSHDRKLKTAVLISDTERDYLTSLAYEDNSKLEPTERKDRQIFIGQEHEKADNKVLDHVNTFWARWGLSLPFKIECKWPNAGNKAVWFGSSDYAIDVSEYTDKSPIIKSRGAKQKDHPKQLFLRHLLDSKNNVMPTSRYDYSEILGINDYLQNPDRFPDLLPGDDQTATTFHRPFKNGQTFDTFWEYNNFERNKTDLEKLYDKTDKTELYGLSRMMTNGYSKVPNGLQKPSR